MTKQREKLKTIFYGMKTNINLKDKIKDYTVRSFFIFYQNTCIKLCNILKIKNKIQKRSKFSL